jgi:hypothetical protein
MTDPYASPQSDIEISEGIIDALRGTRGWVLFIAILLVLGAVAMVCGGGFMMLGGVAGVAGGAGGAEGAMILGMAVFYIIFAAFYALPAWWLFRYFSAIGDAVAYQDTASVEKALLAQRSFWRGIGVMIILFLLLYFVLIGVMMVAGIMGAAAF